jgi:DNA polymerase-3 subunit alpha
MMPLYVSLHNHTEFSLLDGAAKIDSLVSKACRCAMSHVAISDHGNLYGVPKFVMTAKKHGVKPVIGSEFYLAARSRFEKKGADNENDTFHQILFVKNATGYKNIVKLSSLAFTEGYHFKPRIDFELLKQYSAGLIATTCCLASEINQCILKKGEAEAEKIFLRYLEVFGSDYYVELQRHGLRDQERCNSVLLRWAKKYDVKIVASNDVHYVEEEDSEAHDLLLALQTGRELNDPHRFRFTDDTGKNLNRQFYFKTPEEMGQIFSDLPHALENTVEVAEKCDFELKLTGDLIMPTYRVPPEFETMDDYLAHLAWKGAKRKYGEITAEVEERIRRELAIIKQMGFAGYFLIVQEFTNEARKRGVMVGPGRGSAAGSVVAYATGIIDIDPLQYNLLFERFLNPERISPPDIDIDFDDEGRQQVIDFVIEKYGKECVTQIITYGTMGAKTAVKDVGRVLGVPLHVVNEISKLIPERPGMTFDKALSAEENPEHWRPLHDVFHSPDPLIQKMMKFAKTLEGSARHTGIHAAGVIIAPTDVSDIAPVAINNTRDRILTTQWDGPTAELAGLLKMDFLGLKNLSIIKTAVEMIEKNRGVKIDVDRIPIDDPKTYELYQRGETVATFQFESDGMRKYLKELKPTNIEDLIAMNALYRPGPMDNIPSFIRRKHGLEKIEYLHPLLEPILRNTYGIMVYQEQIMECARALGGYTLGGADLLRRAMGKKKKDVMEKERAHFKAGAQANGIAPELADEIFSVMEKFAEYGFNKSHSAAYSVLAFRTAYLKAHYPAEYMAAVLSHNLDNIEKISYYIEECRRMGIKVLPPSVNESKYLFWADPVRGEIRFGLGAIKGVGEASAKAVSDERAAGGRYRSLFDLAARVPAKLHGKRVLESLAYAGALDGLGEVDRSQFFSPYSKTDESTAIDKAVMYAASMQKDKTAGAASLFGGDGTLGAALEPVLPPVSEPWPLIVKLNHERNVIGFYLSGHPLDRYRDIIAAYANVSCDRIAELKRRDVRFGAIVTHAVERVSKKGSKFGQFVVEDYSGKTEFSLFNEDYAKFKGFLEINNSVFIRGRYEPRFQSETEYELRVTDVRLLEDVAKMVREVCIRLPVGTVSASLVHSLDNVVSKYRGKCPLKFRLKDERTGTELALQSRTVCVEPVPELYDELRKLEVAFSIR